MSDETAFIYKITNTLNGKEYIGVSKNPKLRFTKHCQKPNSSRKSILSNAIHAHGKENFSMQILCQGSKEYCYELEKKAIKVYVTRTPDGYNITAGGLGYSGFIGAAHHKYGKKNSPELNEHMRQLFLGRPIPPEQRAKISASLKGKKQSLESVEKRRQKMIGQKRSEQSKQNMRGWKMSEEGKEKIRQNRFNVRNYVSTPEQNQAQAERMKALWADPELRAKRMANMKKKVTP
jgi:group I intron endonuclease